MISLSIDINSALQNAAFAGGGGFPDTAPQDFFARWRMGETLIGTDGNPISIPFPDDAGLDWGDNLPIYHETGVGIQAGIRSTADSYPVGLITDPTKEQLMGSPQAYTVAMVVQRTGNATGNANTYNFDGIVTNNIKLNPSGQDRILCFGSYFFPIISWDTGPHLVIVSAEQGVGSEIWWDNVSLGGDAAAGTESFANIPLRVGSNKEITSGYFAHYTRILTSEERDDIFADTQSIYGIS